MNHHDILGVSKSASTTEIRQAFRSAAKEIHPDHNHSPEAAEAFARIKEAHDALMKTAETPRESVTSQKAAATAAAKTAQATYAAATSATMTDDELAHIQHLDIQARQHAKRSFFKKVKDSAELRRHRNKIKTNERRLRGLY